MRRVHLTEPAAGAALLRRARDPWRVALLQAAALLPPAAAALALRGPGVLGVLTAALVAALFWETAFAVLRGRGPTANGATTALIVAIMAPADAVLWQVFLAVSFGAVIGELVFGGRGFGLVNAGLAALAFLLFSFPGTALPDPDPTLALAVLPGAALLWWTGLLDWRLPLAMAAAALVVGGGAPPATLVAIAVPAVFLVGDPCGSAATGAGRVAQGAGAGALAWLFAGGAAVPDAGAVVFAALVAGIFAPLADAAAIRLAAVRREARHG